MLNRNMLRFKFLGGFNLETTLNFSQKLIKKNRIPVLNYAVEDRLNSKSNFILYKNMIDKVNSNYSIAIKFSSFNFNEEYIYKVIERSKSKNIKIFLDAECNDEYLKYLNLSNRLIEEFNTKETVIYKTYQMYRRDSLKTLIDEYKYFNSKNINLGVKLVRGAYYNTEKNMGHLFNNKEDTDFSYNEGILYLHNKSKVNVILATHNNESINIGLKLNSNKNFKFAHLLDMSNKIYDKVSKNNDTYVYIPFGPVNKMLPYLVRRLYENYDILKYMI